MKTGFQFTVRHCRRQLGYYGSCWETCHFVDGFHTWIIRFSFLLPQLIALNQNYHHIQEHKMHNISGVCWFFLILQLKNKKRTQQNILQLKWKLEYFPSLKLKVTTCPKSKEQQSQGNKTMDYRGWISVTWEKNERIIHQERHPNSSTW